MSCWVVTGTDTDVGKSVVTAALAAAFARRGHGVRALKPLASGVEDGTPGEDAVLIASGAGHPPLSWARFRTPVSPHRAQAVEGRMDLAEDELHRWIADHREEARVSLIEGAGGWRVPLMLGSDRRYLQLRELARRNEAPVIVVAADRLGVLNHTLLTLDAIRADGLPIQGVILNRIPGVTDLSSASNLEDLQTLCSVPVHAFPPLDPGDVAALAQAGMAAVRALRMRIVAA